MAENSAADVRLDANSNGMVYFASDVVATIAGLAVTEVEGVANTVGGSNGFADIFARRVQGNARNLTRGVKVEVTNQEVSVDVTIVVEYGSPVPEVACGIQENVKKAIETMTGMSVKSVDVHVVGVSFERENRAVAELEMRQRKLLDKQAAPEDDAAEAPIDSEPEAEAPEDCDDDFELVLEDVDMQDEDMEDEDMEDADIEDKHAPAEVADEAACECAATEEEKERSES